MSFVKMKFNRMLVVGTMTMAVNYVVMLSGAVIVGNLVGADGLSALNICTPVFGGASFLASLLSVGTALVFSRAMGAFDEQRAARVFSHAMVVAIGLGAAIFVAMWFGEMTFLDLTGVTGEVRLQAESYWRWQMIAMALLPSVLTLEALVYADGDGAVALLAGGLHVIGSIGLSCWYTWRSGDTGGVSQGTALTMMAVLIACSAHFYRRNNHLRFRSGSSFSDLREILAGSLADSTIYLCWGVLILIVNRFAVAEFGQGLLPVVALAASVVEFSIVFDGVGEALIPVGGMYAGEDNKPAQRTLANHSALVATAEGIVCGALLWFLAPQIAAWYGFRGESAALMPEAVRMARTLAFAMPFMGLLMMMNTHYLVVGHIPFAVSVTVMKDFVCPCAGALSLGAAFGVRGMWIGFVAGYVVAAAYPFLFVLVRHGRELFPWLIARDDGRSIDFTVRLTERSLFAAVDRIAEYLNGHDVFGVVVGRVKSVLADAGAATIGANRKRVACEYFVSLGEKGVARVVVRDDGRMANAKMRPPEIEGVTCKRLNTIGCNRTEYRFDIM